MGETARLFLLKFIFAIVIFGILINDPGRYFQTYLFAKKRAKEAVDISSTTYTHTKDQNFARSAAYNNLKSDGGKLVFFEVKNERIIIKAAYPVTNTIFIQRINALSQFSEVVALSEQEAGF